MKHETIQKIKYYVLKLFITTFAIVFSAWLMQGGIHIGDPKLLTGVTVAGILILINLFLKPAFVALTIPFTVVTLGLFLLIINALTILLIDFLVDKFTVDSFWYALGFSMLVSFTTSIIEGIGRVRIIRYNKRDRNSDDEDDFSDYEEL
ncbi:MAG: phage holin family protein [Bacteroidales bacterium]|jgi:putative membrane protein|nr:phage holin family protein [Bacteroidales bacterium]